MPKSRAQTTTILGAISASGQVKFSLRRPQPPAMKRKQRDYAERINAGTVTGQDMFLRIADKLDNDSSTVRRLNVAGFLHSSKDFYKHYTLWERSTNTKLSNRPTHGGHDHGLSHGVRLPAYATKRASNPDTGQSFYQVDHSVLANHLHAEGKT